MKNLARLGLFGYISGGKEKPGWGRMLLGDLLYFTTGIDSGLPSVLDRIEYYRDVLMSAMFGEDDELPHDFPAKLYLAIEKVLHSRGGVSDKENAQPNFYSKRNGCMSNPLTWTVHVYAAETSDPTRLESFEASIEEALNRNGYDVNVRILRRPLRIEIDKPNPPTVTLSEYWSSIAALPQNELWSVPGVTASDKGLVLFARKMSGDSYSALVSGKSNAGKTQLALALVLSMAYTNGPRKLSMVIIDPKVIDMMILSALPQLACPVVTDENECLTVLSALVDEMDNRKRRLQAGDRSFLDQYIMLYIDEMSDLQASLTGSDREDAIVAVQRLSQKGRAYGIIVIGATQRVYAVDARMYGNMNDKYALTANNGSDGFAATGIKGVQVHKLPGKGACELWPDGTRLQGFFVADSKADDYDQRIGRFVGDIRRRWAGESPFWTANLGADGQPELPIMDDSHGNAKALDTETMAALVRAYQDNPSKFRVATVHSVYNDLTGKRINHARAQRAYEAVTSGA